MDYGQWQYENKKKQHDAKRKQHIIQVKELNFRPTPTITITISKRTTRSDS